MDAIRKFIEVKDHSFTVDLPKDFTAKMVEVIIMPSPEENNVPIWHKEIIEKRLADYKANPENATDFDAFLDKLQKELL